MGGSEEEKGLVVFYLLTIIITTITFSRHLTVCNWLKVVLFGLIIVKSSVGIGYNVY